MSINDSHADWDDFFKYFELSERLFPVISLNFNGSFNSIDSKVYTIITIYELISTIDKFGMEQKFDSAYFKLSTIFHRCWYNYALCCRIKSDIIDYRSSFNNTSHPVHLSLYRMVTERLNNMTQK